MPRKRSTGRSASAAPVPAPSAAPPEELAPAEPASLPAVAIPAEEWERRKEVVGFTSRDEAVLRELHLVARTYADEVMDELYSRWMAIEEMRAFFPDEATTARVKVLQKKYFLDFTGGRYSADYCSERLRIGLVHRRIGLTPRWLMAGYTIYLQLVLPRVLAAFEYNRSKASAAVNALTKLILLDLGLALHAYYGGRDGAP